VSKNYEYSSILAPFMQGLVDEKRAMGFSYDSTAYVLKEFDQYCVDKELSTIHVTRNFMDDWMKRKDTEGAYNQTGRVSASRQLLLYMAGLGHEAYIPVDFTTKKVHPPHVFTHPELISFFEELDAFVPAIKGGKCRIWEYKVFFRVLYCTGMRCGELLKMPVSEVDLVNGTMTIYQSKGHKDRVVYLADDVCQLCVDYLKCITKELGYEPHWFFPGRNPDDHMSYSSMNSNFNRFWNATPYADKVDKKPTVHSFRFTFVVDRMNDWMEQGVDLETMLPYLSKYLGHKGVRETFYYYIMTNDVNRIIRQKDHFGRSVIPKLGVRS